MTTSDSRHQGWLEIRVDIHPVAHESLSAFLFDLGCSGVVSEDFQDRSLKAYFPFRKDLEDLRGQLHLFVENLKELFPEIGSPAIAFNKIEDQDWGLSWRRFFRPERITPRLMVFPAWERVPPHTEGHVIRMDPGTAFGTGQHPTTRMCLKAMDRLSLPPSWSLMDVGTGSGILAIYGAKVGACRVVGIDNDPEALRWARRNVALNGLSEALELSSRPVERWKERFTLLAANLVLQVILDLLPCFRRVLDTGGWLILSGILESQVEEVDRKLADHGFRKTHLLHDDEWVCITARERDV